jgi:L-alanine-DL-glutamate epimerase-like enolase superfamily enzyme
MRIQEVAVTRFRHPSYTVRDAEGHRHPGRVHEVVQTVTTITTDGGVAGHCFGGSEALCRVVSPILEGQDPFERERLWQTLRRYQRLVGEVLSDRNLAVVDLALWDLLGHALDLPVNKLLGAYRDAVPAYGSTMCGDDLRDGLNSPEAYADFAQALLEEGYPAIKLHTWMPPLGPDPQRDVAACRAVRDRVGPDVRLMLDCYHDYSRTDALYIGRALEELGFYWIEEPMNEQSMESYIWLTRELRIPVVGPETLSGKMHTRAEWLLHGAADISRYSTQLGGITPAMKTVHLCEAFGVPLEMHGAHAGNLQVLGAMGIPGEYYERGLLHPLVDYAAASPWLNELFDPMDEIGRVHISQKPGLGLNVNWDFIERQKV